MQRRTVLAGLMATPLFPFAAQSATAYAGDIAWLIDQFAAHYAYLPDRHVDLAKLRAMYVPRAKTVTDDHVFLGLLEDLLAEFHDHHIEANTNNADSPQLVPTSAEAWAGFQNGRAIIEAVLPGSSLAGKGALPGVRAGDEIISFGREPVAKTVAKHAPRCLAQPDPEADDYTLRVLLAGTHRAARALDLRTREGGETVIYLPAHQPDPPGPLLSIRRIDGDIACLRIENSLGNTDLIAEFDKALADIKDVRGLILDLRNTPSGGNTDVAEPILGRFISGRPGYQRVFRPGPGRTLAKNSYVRWVRERGPFRVTANLVVLCSRWTGSMGEGMTIGLDGMGRAKVVGTRMAGLRGATESFKLPASGIGVNFPVERLYHLNGTPREEFVPHDLVDLATASGDDPILARGIQELRGMSR